MTTTTNPSTAADEATRAIANARIRLMQNPRWAFFGQLSLNLVPVLDPRRAGGTVSTDGTHLYYGPGWITNQTAAVREAAIAHEALHCALRHVYRLAGRDLTLANVAADHVVNLALLASGFTLWQGALADPKYTGMSFEQVYAILKRERDQQQAPPPPQQPEPQPEPEDEPEDGPEPQPEPRPEPEDEPGDDQDEDEGDDGEPADDGEGEPSAAGAPGDGEPEPAGDEGDFEWDQPGGMIPPTEPTGDGEPASGGPGEQAGSGTEAGAPSDTTIPAERAMSELAWVVATEQAALKSRKLGEIEPSLNRLVTEANRQEEDIWEVLRRYVAALAPTNFTWQRPNRRLAWTGAILPGTVREGIGPIGVAVDTSGSVDRAMLARFSAGLTAIMDDYRPEKLIVVYADDALRGVQEFVPGDEVKLEANGGGGTLFQPALDYFSDLEVVPEVVIYLTDLYGENTYGRGPVQPDYDVIWVSTEASTVPAPFGERLTMRQV